MGIEGGGGEDDLREAGGAGDRAAVGDAAAVAGDAVQRLRPPLVGGDAEARHGGRRVDQLRDLLVQCQPRHEVASSLRNRQRSPAEAERFGARIGRVARVRRLSRLAAAAEEEEGGGEEEEEGTELHLKLVEEWVNEGKV